MSSTTLNRTSTTTGTSSGNIARQIIVVVATISTIVINSLSQILKWNNQTTADVSNRYTTLFTPANFAFGIWGLIYLGLMAYAIYQALPAQRDNDLLRRITPFYLASSVANMTWIVLFQFNQLVFSCVVIVILLLSLIAVYIRLDGKRAGVSTAERWLVHVPFSIYLGWVCVATIANIALTLYSLNYRGEPIGEPAWAVIMLVVGALLASIFAVTRREVALVLVFVWAYSAIVSKQSAAPLVAGTAALMIAIMLVVLLVSVFQARSRQSVVTRRRALNL